MALLPTEALNRLSIASKKGRLAHAYLVTGMDGSGLEQFVAELAAAILQTETEKVTAHPDFHSVRPESKSRRILIDQMRDLEHAIHQRSTNGPCKVAAIFDADRMMEQGANAFLKTLEEPPPGTHLLLSSSIPDAMLDTILSRCIEIPLRHGKPPEFSPREEAARDIARTLLDHSTPPGLPAIFLAVRKFQQLLAAVRDESRKQAEETLKAEKAHYKDRTDTSAKWLEEMEARLAATGESAVLAERTRLLHALSSVMAERLRLDVASGDPRIGRSEAIKLLSQIDTVDQLRISLERNLHETLALEAGFLEIFSTL